jgi:hypothetical protein
MQDAQLDRSGTVGNRVRTPDHSIIAEFRRRREREIARLLKRRV